MDEYSVQSLGFINRLKNRLNQTDQRTAFDAFIILLILIGLAASVYLAGQRQIFRSRAAQEGSAVVLDKDGNPPPKDEQGNAVVETPQIRIKIDFPTEWNTQGFLPSVVKPAYGIHSINHPLCGTKFPATSQGKDTICADSGGGLPGGLGKTCGAYVGDYDAQDCLITYKENYKYCFVYDPCPATAPTSTPTPTQPPAQQTCLGTGGKCASPDAQGRGVTSEGLLCSSYLSNITLDNSCANTNPGYNYCYLNCAAPPAAAQPTATPAQPTIDTSTPEITGTITWVSTNVIGIPGKNFGSGDVIWYSPGGSQESKIDPNSVKWVPDYITVTLNQVQGGYVRVCKTNGKCSSYTPIPDRQATQPTPTPAPATGSPQTPTATPEPETTQWIRISLNEANVRSGNCFREPKGPGVGSPSPSEHCMEFSTTNPYFTQRGNMADLWLPNQPGLHTIFIGFVSNKGNLKPGLLLVKVNYRPKTTSLPTPQVTSKPGIECINAGGVCVNSANVSEQGNICRGGTDFEGYDCPPAFSFCKKDSENCTPSAPTLELSGYCSDNGTKLNLSWNSIPGVDKYGLTLFEIQPTLPPRPTPTLTPEGIRPPEIRIGGFVIPKNVSSTYYTQPAVPGYTYEAFVDYLRKGENQRTKSNSVEITCKTSSSQPTPKPSTTCNKLFDNCMRFVGIKEGATEAHCSKIKGQCELLKTGGTPPTPTPTPSPFASPTQPDTALPITGKVKITANGTQYKKVMVAYYLGDEIRLARLSLEIGLPTNSNQTVNYITEPMRRSSTRVWSVVVMSDEERIVNSIEVDCPGSFYRDARGDNYDYGCIVKKDSTQDLSVTLPAPTPTGPSEKERTLCTNVLSACLGGADTYFERTHTRCNNIYSYCINEQGYKNQKQLWDLLNSECLQQEQECRDAFITGGLFGGKCSANRDSCNDRIRSLGLTQSP